MPVTQSLRGAFNYMADMERITGRRSANSIDQNPEAYQQIQEDPQEDIEPNTLPERSSLDGHMDHLQRRLSTEGLITFPTEFDNHTIFDEDTAPLYIPDSSLSRDEELIMREDFFSNRNVRPRREELKQIPMPKSKEYRIRERLIPITSGLEELESCFCGNPYADPTSTVEKDTHEAVELPECGHVFGKCCIVQWLNDSRHRSCPICRERFWIGRNPPVDDLEVSTEMAYPLILDHLEGLYLSQS